MKITFCINVCKNEKNHLNLLLHSMAKNFGSRDHEILVFVETDENEEITNYLKFFHKEIFPNLKILRNRESIPIGYATNINKMFEMAENEVVSYLQADMVVGKNYDEEILKNLTPDIIQSSTRIEPPLHPPSQEKHTMDFGTDPEKFDMDSFISFTEVNKKNQMTDYFFAPFTLYKRAWLVIGGHDVLFRRSREDSDIVWRLLLNGMKTKQCWNAMVYHFTCTSSRGNEWWKNNTREIQIRTSTQMKADQIELMKFMRKWGTFSHPSTPKEANHFKYNVDAQICNCDKIHADVLLNLFPTFRKISVDNTEVLIELKKKFDDLQSPANFLFGISDDNWKKYGQYYNQARFEDVYGTFDVSSSDILTKFSLPSVLYNPAASVGITNIQQILHDNIEVGESGTFEMEGVRVIVNGLKNSIQDNIYVHNPTFDINLEIL